MGELLLRLDPNERTAIAAAVVEGLSGVWGRQPGTLTDGDSDTVRCYTPQEVAKLLQCSIDTVRDLLRSGQLPSFPLRPDPSNTRTHVRVRHHDLAAFQRQRKESDAD